MRLVLVVMNLKDTYCVKALPLRTPTPPGKDAYLKIAPGCEVPWLKCGIFLSRKEFLPLPPQSALSLVVSSFNIVVQFSFRGNYSKSSCKFVISVGGGEFRTYLWCHLDTKLGFLLSVLLPLLPFLLIPENPCYMQIFLQINIIII